MLNFKSLVLFFILATPLAANSLDANDKQKITNHFNTYVKNGSLPNVSILIKKDNKEIYRHANGYADLENKISINIPYNL